MKRRTLLAAIGATSASPLVARSQPAGMPVIGFLGTSTEEQTQAYVVAFRRGLKETGFVEGANVLIEFRRADGQYGRLPDMAAEFVRRPVNLIAAQAPPAALAAKAATSTIPIVFVVGIDPIRAGLVSSLGRPGGNATGMTLMSVSLAEKRVQMLRELAPTATVLALLVNPASPDTELEISLVRAAAQSIGLQVALFEARRPEDIAGTFAAIAARRPDALVVATDSFLQTQREEIATRAAGLKVPAVYPFRNYAEAGGLMSYGTNITNAYRQAGIYAGRILKGEPPQTLSVIEPATFNMVINLKTAGMLGISIPAAMHARADEVIE